MKSTTIFVTFYFLKIKYTAAIKSKKPMIWLVLKVSFLKTSKEKIVKMVKVITSCITFNSAKEKRLSFPECSSLIADLNTVFKECNLNAYEPDLNFYEIN